MEVWFKCEIASIQEERDGYGEGVEIYNQTTQATGIWKTRVTTIHRGKKNGHVVKWSQHVMLFTGNGLPLHGSGLDDISRAGRQEPHDPSLGGPAILGKCQAYIRII